MDTHDEHYSMQYYSMPRYTTSDSVPFCSLSKAAETEINRNRTQQMQFSQNSEPPIQTAN